MEYGGTDVPGTDDQLPSGDRHLPVDYERVHDRRRSVRDTSGKRLIPRETASNGRDTAQAQHDTRSNGLKFTAPSTAHLVTKTLIDVDMMPLTPPRSWPPIPTFGIAAGSLTAFVKPWQKLKKYLSDPYRPELHYMRGPGPKWKERNACTLPADCFDHAAVRRHG
jgi:hypothetical protein